MKPIERRIISARTAPQPTKKAAIFEVPGPEAAPLINALKDARFGPAGIKIDFMNEKKGPTKKFFKS